MNKYFLKGYFRKKNQIISLSSPFNVPVTVEDVTALIPTVATAVEPPKICL